jgi:hypothetical protein
MTPRKFLRLPINAIPSTPIKKAMALEVKIPAIILVIIAAELRCTTLNNTLVLMYLIRLFN